MATFAVVLAAAGQSSRFRNSTYKKPFAPLANRAVWLHSAERFVNRDDVQQVLVVVSPEDREDFLSRFGANVAILGIQVVEGGKERADSIERALARVEAKCEYVCVHDAARPCLVDEWIDRVFAAAVQHGAAILAVPVASTLKRVSDSKQVEETVPRQALWEAQTPQVFRTALLRQAYAQRQGFAATDCAQLVERLGESVAVVPGSAMNLKITTAEDLRMAEAVQKVLPRPKASGPAHPFADEERWR